MALLDGSGQRPLADRFDRVVAALRQVRPRPDVTVDEVPAPQRLATHAAAFSADVHDQAGDDIGTGRLVLLHEPGGHEAWGGEFRLVTFVKASVETDLATDPLLPGVAWSWLLEALAAQGAVAAATGGTVTQVTNESFGALGDQPSVAEVEIRASWTPLPVDGDTSSDQTTAATLAAHMQAWLDVLCTTAGLEPLPEGVVALPRPRHGR